MCRMHLLRDPGQHPGYKLSQAVKRDLLVAYLVIDICDLIKSWTFIKTRNIPRKTLWENDDSRTREKNYAILSKNVLICIERFQNRWGLV